MRGHDQLLWAGLAFRGLGDPSNRSPSSTGVEGPKRGSGRCHDQRPEHDHSCDQQPTIHAIVVPPTPPNRARFAEPSLHQTQGDSDWRQRYKLRRLTITADPGGQPRVVWRAEATETATGHTKTVHGHVEIRWSHGRFAQTPEAKVYLDTLHHDVPGYAACGHERTVSEITGAPPRPPSRRRG